jgi:hypothetical protein
MLKISLMGIKKILLVDDDEDILDIVTFILLKKATR